MFPYAQLVSNKGWIANVVPCNEDATPAFFYGPDVLNIRIFTNLDCLDYYSGDTIQHPHAKRLIATYDSFYRYHTFVILDAQVKTPDNAADFARFDGQLIKICTDMKDYGFEYLGVVDSAQGSISTYLSERINNYFSNAV